MHNRTRKVLHICIIIVILVTIAFTALILALKYDNEGETNMPFYISKISIISTTDAQDAKGVSKEWNKIINLNNDVYIFIDKNEDYNKTETIKNIKINNFRIIKDTDKGELAIYKPSKNKDSVFNSKEENRVTEVIFEGDLATDIQSLKISNQRGRIAFRCANNNIGTYISKDEKQIKYTELLKKIGINYKDIDIEISFDIEIELGSGRKYLATAQLAMPTEDIVEKGKTGIELTELNDIIFKRIEN